MRRKDDAIRYKCWKQKKLKIITLYIIRRRPSGNECWRALAAGGIFFGYVILRCFLSPVEYLARVDLYMVLAALMVYLLFTLILTVPVYRFIFVMTLLVIGLVHVSIGGVQYLRGERFTLFDFLQRADYGLRATGLYICPNHLAGYLEVSALMGLSIVCWSRRNVWLKLLAAYGSIICALGIVLTGSRGAYLSTFFGLFVFLVLSIFAIRRANRHQFWISAVGAIAIAAVMFAGITALFSRQYALQSRAAKIFATDDGRLDTWKAAIEQSKVRPVFGTGAGTYQYYARMFRPPRTQADPVYAHNDYLQLLAEFGWLGLLLGLAFVAFHLWWGWRALNYCVTDRPAIRYRLQSDALALNIGALSCLAIYVVHSVLDFNLHIPANAMLLAFVFGTLANPGMIMPFASPAYDKISRYLKLVAPAIGLWMAAVGLPKLPAEYFCEQSRVAFKEERNEESVASAKLGLAGDAKNPFLWLYLGQAQASIAESTNNAALAQPFFTDAVQSFRNGLTFYPQEQWLLIGLGAALDGLGRFDEAHPIYLEAVRWNPTSAYIRNYYATHLRLAGRFADAETEYNKSLALYWNQGAAHGLSLIAKAREAQAKP